MPLSTSLNWWANPGSRHQLKRDARIAGMQKTRKNELGKALRSAIESDAGVHEAAHAHARTAVTAGTELSNEIQNE